MCTGGTHQRNTGTTVRSELVFTSNPAHRNALIQVLAVTFCCPAVHTGQLSLIQVIIDKVIEKSRHPASAGTSTDRGHLV